LQIQKDIEKLKIQSAFFNILTLSQSNIQKTVKKVGKLEKLELTRFLDSFFAILMAKRLNGGTILAKNVEK